MNQTQENTFKVYLACLENVKERETNIELKEKLEKIIHKLSQQGREQRLFQKLISDLPADQKKVFQLLLDGYKGFKDAFVELHKEELKNIIETNFDLNDYLLKLIPSIVLLNDRMNHEGVISKFYVPIMKEAKKMLPNHPSDFARKWRDRAKIKIDIIAEKREKRDTQTTNSIKIQQKRPIRQEQAEQNNKLKSKSIQKVEGEKGRERDRLKEEQRQRQSQRRREREQKQRLQQQRHQQQQKEQDRSRRRNREQDEKRKDDGRRKDDSNKKIDKKEADKRQGQKLLKGRTTAIENYIQHTRKDIRCTVAKNKQLSQFLVSRLDQFLKNAIEKMYDVACLKNKKNLKFGNELGYFSEESNRVSHEKQFYYQPNTKIYSLAYQHKHTIYNILRMNQIKKEEELRSSLEPKPNDVDKRIEKKIENYILKPRPKESDMILDAYREEKEGFKSQTVGISLQHVIYFLQNHFWLKDSLLLFNVTHRY